MPDFPTPLDATTEIDRAARAKRLLEDPLFVEAADTVRNALVDRWRTSPVRDAEGRETAFLMLRMLDEVVSHLASVISTGEMARHKSGATRH